MAPARASEEAISQLNRAEQIEEIKGEHEPIETEAGRILLLHRLPESGDGHGALQNSEQIGTDGEQGAFLRQVLGRKDHGLTVPRAEALQKCRNGRTTRLGQQ